MPHDTSNMFEWTPGARILTPGAGSLCSSARAVHTTGAWYDIPAGPAADVLPSVYGAVAAGQGFSIVPPRIPAEPAPARLDQSGPIFATWTGGTTGRPRRVLRSHESWIASFDINAAKFNIAPGAIVAVFGTLSHSLALYGAMEALHLGADLLDLCGIRPDRQREQIHAFGATMLYITPVQLRQLVAGADGRPLESVRHILVGGAALDDTVRALAQTVMPRASLHVFFGASETSFVTLSDEDTPPGSVGKAYPGVEISLHGPDDAPVAEGGAGTIRVQSPYLFLGHGAQPLQIRSTVTLGEIGRRDAAGNLWLLGRRDRMFTVGDQNLYPEAIEAHLQAQPGVDMAGVIPLSDAQRGAVALAFVAGSGAQDHLDALTQGCRRQFGAMIAPRRIIHLNEWPVLTSGKTDYAQLSRLAQDLAQ